MTVPMRCRFRPGGTIGPNHTVLAVVDKASGRHPVLIVWDHRSWCPMACKLFASPEKAAKEARILSALNHPNIVRLFEIGEDAELFIEFVDGATLGALMDRHEEGRFRISDALRIAIHLGAALEHMHARGFVHLDLAPSNVILRRDGRPVLVDLGAARLQGAKRPPRVVGTDPYIAPEECLLQDVCRPADVFGFGVLLFELLTGKLPFPKGTRRDPFPQTRHEPARVRAFRPGVPKGLDHLVSSCLARDPSDRPLLADLLPSLHDHIRGGPRMWPAGFQPGPPAGHALASASQLPERLANTGS
jgi:eukaryotic-like serine/threonine-protein kinase